MCSLLYDLNSEALGHVSSFLAPPDVFALATSNKQLLSVMYGQQAPEQPLGAAELVVAIVQKSMKQHLDRLMKDLTQRTRDCQQFTVEDLFPAVAENSDASQPPQVSVVQTRTEHAIFRYILACSSSTLANKAIIRI